MDLRTIINNYRDASSQMKAAISSDDINSIRACDQKLNGAFEDLLNYRLSAADSAVDYVDILIDLISQMEVDSALFLRIKAKVRAVIETLS